MAMRIRKIVPGKIVGGRFVPNRKGTIRNPKLPKLGSGKRFERCLEEVTARGGAVDPRAVCASRGRRKYGKKKFQALAKAGKKRASKNLFGFGKAKRRMKRAFGRQGYMVLDRDGYPVHTGRDLSKREALEIAKDARRHGEKGIHLFKSNPKRRTR